MAVLVCSLCGTSLEPDDDDDSARSALAWVHSVEAGREQHCCPACARANLRSIEGKLDAEFW